MVSGHVIVLSSFRSKSCVTEGALISEKVVEMFCLNMVSDTGDGLICERVTNCTDVEPRIGIFSHIHV